jgi:hypothetical protein
MKERSIDLLYPALRPGSGRQAATKRKTYFGLLTVEEFVDRENEVRESTRAGEVPPVTLKA